MKALGRILLTVTIVLIVLKSFDQLHWSWWTVLSPVWVVVALFIAVVAVAAIALLGIWVIDRPDPNASIPTPTFTQGEQP
ncbi:hypothetical protein [Paraburkholderia sp. BCC1886]|uniref:hypothetical protein n=1 Tax=Paraburkholderia sp. BCC1886 TaxID=2562670 RepID=UPI0011836250|nr:hypothetical protein [Paraburkholderia sp. BCC1886]